MNRRKRASAGRALAALASFALRVAGCSPRPARADHTIVATDFSPDRVRPSGGRQPERVELDDARLSGHR